MTAISVSIVLSKCVISSPAFYVHFFPDVPYRTRVGLLLLRHSGSTTFGPRITGGTYRPATTSVITLSLWVTRVFASRGHRIGSPTPVVGGLCFYNARNPSQRAHNAPITSLWRQNDVATSFLRHDDIIFASCVRWDSCYTPGRDLSI